MDSPPSYEEANNHHSKDVETKELKHFSLCEEVGISRAQHVAVLVAKLLPHIKERAKAGLSRSVLLILPSDQEHLSRKGQLVGMSDEPLMIQLHGHGDDKHFWSQPEALVALQTQLYTSISGHETQRNLEQPLPSREPEVSSRLSFFTRKASKAPGPRDVVQPGHPPIQVDVELDEANFRSFNDYGLYETLRGPAIRVTVDVR